MESEIAYTQRAIMELQLQARPSHTVGMFSPPRVHTLPASRCASTQVVWCRVYKLLDYDHFHHSHQGQLLQWSGLIESIDQP